MISESYSHESNFSARMEEFKRNQKDRLEKLRDFPPYTDATILDKFALQMDENTFGGFIVAAFSDLDGTYIYIKSPSEKQLAVLRNKKNLEHNSISEDSASLELTNQTLTEEFHKANLQATDSLTSWLADHHVPIIAVSGRDYDSIAPGMPGGAVHQEERFPFFDATLSAVGTSIEVLQKDGSYKKDLRFEGIIRNESGFNRMKLYPLSEKIIDAVNTYKDRKVLYFQSRDSRHNVDAYTLDPDAKAHGSTLENAPLQDKISFNFEEDDMSRAEIQELFETSLRKEGFDRVKVVISSDGITKEGKNRYCIDLVPVTKAEAVNYFANLFGCLAIVSGDSGNDTNSILQAGVAGVMVGNHAQELVEQDERISKLPHSIRKEHFLFYNNPDVASIPRVVFIDTPSRWGPSSELAALKAFNLLFKFMNEEDKLKLMEYLNAMQ